MTKARTLADMISDGVIGTTELADDVITPVKLDETGNYTVAQLSVDGVAQIRGVTVKDSSGTTKGYVQGDNDGLLIASDGSNDITFDVNAVQRMRITSNGRIGINQDVPGYTVDVVGGTNGNTDGIAVRPANETQTMIYSFLGMRNTYFTHFISDSTNSGSSNYFNFYVGTEDNNGQLLHLGNSGTTFNEGGHNRDFRVESDAYSHALFVDASENRVSIGHNSTAGYGSGHVLSVAGGSTMFSNFGEDVVMQIRGGNYTDPNTASILLSGGTGDNGYVREWYMSSVASGGGGAIQNDLKFRYVAGGSATQYEALKLRYNGEVIVNEDGYATNDVRVESDNNAHMFMIDAGMDKAAFGTSPQTALGGLVHTGSVSVGNANHPGYSVYSDSIGNVPSNTTVDVLEFEGPAYARYLTVTISGYLCQKEQYFTGYQSWNGQSGGTVGSTTNGITSFSVNSNSSDSRVMARLYLSATSGSSGNPKYKLQIVTGSLTGQLYDCTVTAKFYNPPQYVAYL